MHNTRLSPTCVRNVRQRVAEKQPLLSYGSVPGKGVHGGGVKVHWSVGDADGCQSSCTASISIIDLSVLRDCDVFRTESSLFQCVPQAFLFFVVPLSHLRDIIEAIEKKGRSRSHLLTRVWCWYDVVLPSIRQGGIYDCRCVERGIALLCGLSLTF